MRNYMEHGWFYSGRQIKHYAVTRFTSLKPPGTKLRNPISILRELNAHQWLLFLVGYLSWTWDAFDFFTVSLSLTEIAKEFHVPNSDVSWGITVTLMLRSVGAIVSGSLADRYGRKWPVIFCLTCFIVLELASGFCNTLTQFLGIRALYGVAMGGLFGPACATALEDLPYDARGLLSGLFEQGYATGYLLAAIFYRALVPTTTHGWRSLFWFGAGPPVLIIIFRLCLPETNHFLVMKAEREAKLTADHTDAPQGSRKATPLRSFLHHSNAAMRQNWVLFVYLVFLMTGFNSCSHGSQDFYPTFLKNQVELPPTPVTIITVIGQLGALAGAITLGYSSTFLGRRLTMILGSLMGGALLPAYILPRHPWGKLVAASFFEQFFVGGVWGVIPIHLIELAPVALRTFFVGVTYQLGNLASSASATIQSKVGEENYPLPPEPDGTKRFDYGKVIAIFMGAVWAYDCLLVFIGPEMSKEERAEEAQRAIEYEKRRMEGTNVAALGRHTVSGGEGLDEGEKASGEAPPGTEDEEKCIPGDGFSKHVETAAVA